MAKKPKASPIPLTREEQIARAIREFKSFKCPSPTVIATPTRSYVSGQKVLVGNLNNCVIVESLSEFDDKAYVVETDTLTNRQNPIASRQFRVDWWFNIEDKLRESLTPRMFKPFRRGQLTTSDINSLYFMYSNDGFVCNADYQRGYVWNEFDREQLLDSIFARNEIGSFLFVRHSGYLYTDESATNTYVSLEGKEVIVKCSENYLCEIIDGQQRLTTIIMFMLDKFKYRGQYYSELSFRDRIDFEATMVSYRTIDEQDISREELLELFIQVNRGVPQNPEHLAKVQAMLDDERSKKA